METLKNFLFFSSLTWLPFAIVGTVEYISQAYASENTLPPSFDTSSGGYSYRQPERK